MASNMKLTAMLILIWQNSHFSTGELTMTTFSSIALCKFHDINCFV